MGTPGSPAPQCSPTERKLTKKTLDNPHASQRIHFCTGRLSRKLLAPRAARLARLPNAPVPTSRPPGRPPPAQFSFKPEQGMLDGNGGRTTERTRRPRSARGSSTGGGGGGGGCGLISGVPAAVSAGDGSGGQLHRRRRRRLTAAPPEETAAAVAGSSAEFQQWRPLEAAAACRLAVRACSTVS